MLNNGIIVICRDKGRSFQICAAALREKQRDLTTKIDFVITRNIMIVIISLQSLRNRFCSFQKRILRQKKSPIIIKELSDDYCVSIDY
jgi:hypothetical protein